jgi:hypothetical protein
MPLRACRARTPPGALRSSQAQRGVPGGRWFKLAANAQLHKAPTTSYRPFRDSSALHERTESRQQHGHSQPPIRHSASQPLRLAAVGKLQPLQLAWYHWLRVQPRSAFLQQPASASRLQEPPERGCVLLAWPSVEVLAVP